MSWFSDLAGKLIAALVGAVAGALLLLFAQRRLPFLSGTAVGNADAAHLPYMAPGTPTPTTDDYKASLGLSPQTPLFTPTPPS